MSWLGVEGHDDVVERFRRSLRRGRLASTFLFVGPGGVGKRLFAMRLAQSLLCESTAPDQLDACGHCAACHQVQAMTHPDLEVVRKPEDKSVLPVELFIGDKEHRMREGLCHRIAMRPSRGGRRVAIIDDADAMSPESANCLLKTLEEPPPRSVLILVSTSAQRQLPTIRSRCQLVPFQPLPIPLVERLLLESQLVDDPQVAARLSQLSEGSLERAAQLNEPELWEFRARMLELFVAGSWDASQWVPMLTQFVEAAGKEMSRRRDRLRAAIRCVIEFLRQLVRTLASGPPSSGDALQKSIDRLAQLWPQDAEAAADMIQTSLETLTYIDANAHVPTVLDAWVDALMERYGGVQAPGVFAEW